MGNATPEVLHSMIALSGRIRLEESSTCELDSVDDYQREVGMTRTRSWTETRGGGNAPIALKRIEARRGSKQGRAITTISLEAPATAILR
jgi:endonuclease YncB( thermonuclease family)